MKYIAKYTQDFWVNTMTVEGNSAHEAQDKLMAKLGVKFNYLRHAKGDKGIKLSNNRKVWFGTRNKGTVTLECNANGEV